MNKQFPHVLRSEILCLGNSDLWNRRINEVSASREAGRGWYGVSGREDFPGVTSLGGSKSSHPESGPWLSFSIRPHHSHSPLAQHHTPAHMLTVPASSLASPLLIPLSDSICKPTTSASLLKLWYFPPGQPPFCCFAPPPLAFTWRAQHPTCCISCPLQRFITIICHVPS